MPSPEFFQVLPVDEALRLLDANWQPAPQTEILPTASALNRIVAADLVSAEQAPSFRKSTVDGSCTAPTSITLELAQAWNICVAGYVRGGSMHVYTHAWRFGLSE